MTIYEEFHIFIRSSLRCGWIGGDRIRVYLRKSRRCPSHKLMDYLDIANVSVSPEYQNQGLFKSFLTYVEAHGYNIFVESVVNTMLAEKLMKYGYTPVLDSIPTSFYKIHTPGHARWGRYDSK